MWQGKALFGVIHTHVDGDRSLETSLRLHLGAENVAKERCRRGVQSQVENCFWVVLEGPVPLRVILRERIGMMAASYHGVVGDLDR